VYDMLGGRYGFGGSQMLSKEETLARLPTIKTEGLRGGVVYYDGQFDDARLLINLAATAVEQGAVALNSTPATAMTRDADGFVDGIVARDLESGRAFHAAARVVVNAGGPQSDLVRRLAHPDAAPLIAPSQGIHLVFDGSFLPGGNAIMVPHTTDGRVMFAIPWHGHTVVGTTDTPIGEVPLEPRPLDDEIEFILETAGRYLHRPIVRADVLSVFVGVRPLVRSGSDANTASLSRDHTIHIDSSGLLTIAGGKWTTYRHMAEDCVDHAATLARLPEKPCVTRNLNVHGFHRQAQNFGALSVYGSDALLIQDLIRVEPDLARPLHPLLSSCAAEVVWAARVEMARSVEDVLARRTRALFLNARAAMEMAPETARLLARELGRDEAWQRQQIESFGSLARGYVVEGAD
jgi:glycerol-3-phosphate dehydrogenase